MPKVIDVHWHHVPQAFADRVISGEVPVAGKVVTNDDGMAVIKLDNGFDNRCQAFLTDPATILADMDAAGVDVVSGVPLRRRCRTSTSIPPLG